MAKGFMEGLRRGRDAAIAAGGRRRPSAEVDADESQVDDDASLPDAYRALQAEHEESKRLVAELAETVELLQGRVIELIKGAEPMANVLQLPGVKKYLRMRFHPDQHANASDEQIEKLTEAMQTINAAYAVIEKELHSAED
jgi:hypothetical protein